MKSSLGLMLIAICQFSSFFSQGQTHIIFRDDSNSTYMGRFENSLNQPYYGVPFYDFKEKLPDGTYLRVNAMRKDSAKMDLKNVILIKGQYKDSLRTGKFEYYIQKKIKGQKTTVLTDVYHYKNGLLDGYYMSGNDTYKLYEGNYQDGKRHGFFYTYGEDEKIYEIELYINDSLISSAKYPNITVALTSADTSKQKKYIIGKKK